MKRIVSLAGALAITWWLWSGYATALLLGLGLLSCTLVAWLSHRMQLTDHESIPLHRMHRIVIYWLWLTGEIFISNVAVCQRILTGRIRTAIKKVPSTRGSDQNRVTYANSITLTPGTLSYGIEPDYILVHTLHPVFLDKLAAGRMAAKVNQLEDLT